MNDSSGREIITLQVGRYANFVGTHFWNFQDELVLLASRGGVVDAHYNHNVLHRPVSEQGRGRGGHGGAGGGKQRTPRLVAFDTRDAFGSVNPLGLVGGGGAAAGAAVATAEAAQPSWAGGVSIFRQPTLEKNALHEYLDNEDDAANAAAAAAAVGRGGYASAGGYGGGGRWSGAAPGDSGGAGDMEASGEDEEIEETRVTGDATRLAKHPFGLDDTVSNWPDFLKTILHPRALQELPFRDESSDFGRFTSGGAGSGGALNEGDRERHSDAVRRQLEECDAAQGTQTLVDLEGGWAGLGCALAADLQEECRNHPRVCYAFLRRGGAPAGPGCGVPGAMGGEGRGVAGGSGVRVKGGGPAGGVGAARSAVNLALGLHGLTESFSLSFVLDEEACNAGVSPYMAIDPRNSYHTSAVLGAAIDMASSPLRFSSIGLHEWTSGGVSGGSSVGGGIRVAGAGMTLATLSAWLPLPHPDASAETLAQLLSEHEKNAPSASRLTPVSRMLSLGPVSRRCRGGSRRTQGQSMASGAAAAAVATSRRIYSRQTVWRGFTAPRSQQLEALEQVLHHSGVGSGCSYSVGTPLPIPITFPLVFRESLGLRGQLLSTLPPPPSQLAGGSTAGSVSSRGRGGRDGARQAGRTMSAAAAGSGRGEMRVMCDQISGAACAERNSDMGRFVGQVAEGLDLRRGGVLLELEKNDMHKDDAIEVVESLTGLAESYGFLSEEGEDGAA